jgi:hypothetical protein
LVIALVGCKGSGGVDDQGGGSCSAVTPCGGDVVGAWNVDDICIPDPSVFVQQGIDEAECQDAFQDVDIDASGTMTFTAEGMASTDVSLSIGMHVVWTKACITALNPDLGELETSAACTMLMNQSAMNDMFESASCRVVGANCECEVQLAPRAMTSSGTYTLDGDQIIDDENVAADYCVSGSSMTISAMAEGVEMNFVLSK